MAVLRPLRVVIDNYPDGLVEEMDAVNNPEDASMGTRKVPFSKVLYIEQDDFREDPPKQYFRLAPGREVRLRYGYFITCNSVVKDADGKVVELHCTYDPATRGGNTPDGRKVKSTIHWVSAAHAVDAEVRLYDTLFTKENPNEVEEGQDFTANLNPNSLEVLTGCKVEPSLRDAAAGCAVSVRAAGLFLRRSGFDAGEAGVQSHNRPARRVVKDRTARQEVILMTGSLPGGGVFLHQINRAIGELDQMRMRAIAISQYREAKLAVAIPKQERCVSGNAAAVREVTVAVAHLHPPRQSEPRGFISPQLFNRSFELIVLSSQHLLERLLADDSFAFEDSAVQIRDQPVRLIQHRAIDQPRRPDSGFESHGRSLIAGLLIDDVGNR